jgi:DNA-binding NarL/FixJ family response regulator
MALEGVVARQAPRVAILDKATAAELSVLERLRAARQAIGVIVLAHQPTAVYSTSLFASGAGCLAKDVSAANIPAAVHLAADGRRMIAGSDGHVVEREVRVPAIALTPRQREVFEYLSMGWRHADIARAMQRGVETIRTHTADIRRKFGVRSNLIGVKLPVEPKLET